VSHNIAIRFAGVSHELVATYGYTISSTGDDDISIIGSGVALDGGRVDEVQAAYVGLISALEELILKGHSGDSLSLLLRTHHLAIDSHLQRKWQVAEDSPRYPLYRKTLSLLEHFGPVSTGYVQEVLAKNETHLAEQSYADYTGKPIPHWWNRQNPT